MKHWFGILGERAKEQLFDFNDRGDIDVTKAAQFYGEKWALSVEETARAFVPVNPVWYENGREKIGLALHGIIIPKEICIDAFIGDPSSYYKAIIDRHQEDLCELPLEFYHGVFVGLIMKPRYGEYYVFNSFLNHIPLYYCKVNGNLFFSTNIYLLTRIFSKGPSFNANGILEYVVNGTNISDSTFIKDIYCLSKSSILKYSKKKISTKYYYTFPNDYTQLGKDKLTERSFSLWQEGIKKLHSNKIKIGLGLTGGIDSRLIYAEWTDKEHLLAYTGTHREHPDYVVAHLLAGEFGCEGKHMLEDYSFYSRESLRGSFVEYLKLFDNPLLLTDIVVKKQIEWRKHHNIELQLHGLGGEMVGGELYYFSRSSISGIIKSILPFKYSKMRHQDRAFCRRLVNLGLRNFVGDYLLQFLELDYNIHDYKEFFDNYIINRLAYYINVDDCCENYLERFRAIYKHPNLLSYRYLAGREYYEQISPYFSIPFLDFVFKIPLHCRNDRKLILRIMKKYYPQASSIALVGSFFTPHAPFWLFKTSKPFAKGLNTLKIGIPYSKFRGVKVNQKHDPLYFYTDNKIKKFMTQVISRSDIIHDRVQSELGSFIALERVNYNTLRTTWEKIWRLFCLALAEKRFTLKSRDYQCYIDEVWNRIRESKG